MRQRTNQARNLMAAQAARLSQPRPPPAPVAQPPPSAPPPEAAAEEYGLEVVAATIASPERPPDGPNIEDILEEMSVIQVCAGSSWKKCAYSKKSHF